MYSSNNNNNIANESQATAEAAFALTSMLSIAQQRMPQPRRCSDTSSIATSKTCTNVSDDDSSLVDETDSSSSSVVVRPVSRECAEKIATHKASTTAVQAPVRANPNRGKTTRKLRKNFFPYRLMDVLARPEFSEIICWLHHGKSFVIKDTNAFVEQILSEHFQQKVKNFGSFTRKLNRWGFRMITKGLDSGAYHNPLFCRDKQWMCEMMVCQKSNPGGEGGGKRARRNHAHAMKSSMSSVSLVSDCSSSSSSSSDAECTSRVNTSALSMSAQAQMEGVDVCALSALKKTREENKVLSSVVQSLLRRQYEDEVNMLSRRSFPVRVPHIPQMMVGGMNRPLVGYPRMMSVSSNPDEIVKNAVNVLMRDDSMMMRF